MRINRSTLLFVGIALASPSLASDIQDRLEAAREMNVTAATNGASLAGRKVEILCHVVSTDIDFVVCGVHNKQKQPVGKHAVFMEGIAPKSATYLIDNCADGVVDNTHKPECVVYMTVTADEDGNVYARTVEPVPAEAME